MADNFTPTPVKTKTAGDVIIKIVDTGGVNVAAVSASNALKVDGSAVTQPVSGTVSANQGTANTSSNAWPIKLVDTGGTNVASVSATGALKVDGSAVTQPVSNAGTFAVQDSQVIVDNTGFTDGTSKVFIAGYILDETAGTALTENDAAAARIDSKRAVVFTLEDATTRGQRAAVSAAGAVKVDGSAVTQPVSGTVTANQGSAAVAANRWPVYITDGTNTFPTADAAARALFSKITDGTNTLPTADVAARALFARITDGTNTLGTNTNPLVVVDASESPLGTVVDSGQLTSASLAAAGTANLDGANVGAGLTGRLVEVTASSSVRTKVEIGTWNGTTFTPKRTMFVEANQFLAYKVADSDLIQLTGGTTSNYRLKITNMDNALAADVYGTVSYTTA